MKNRSCALILSALVAMFTSSIGFAQGSPPWVIVPVDIWTCSFNDRQDMGDLDSWADRFNAWSDEQEDDTYAAWTLTSSYFGPDQDWDFIWLGVWKDGNAMGQGWDLWYSTNGNLMAEFLEISTCAAHGNFASAAYRLPEGLDNSAGGVLSVSDCHYRDGVPPAAVDAATRQWVDVLDGAGSQVAMYHWYPAYGGGGETFDFKWVQAYQNYADMGADYERMGNGGLFRQRNALLDNLVDCDSARVYDVTSRRFVNVREGM